MEAPASTAAAGSDSDDSDDVPLIKLVVKTGDTPTKVCIVYFCKALGSRRPRLVDVGSTMHLLKIMLLPPTNANAPSC